jgi:hypothetical protein
MTLGIFLYLDDFQPVSSLTGSNMCGFEDSIYDFHKGDWSERCEISLKDSFPVFQAMAIQCRCSIRWHSNLLFYTISDLQREYKLSL